MQAITSTLNSTLADVCALYIETKNFHWHMRGRHFSHYHQMLNEQATQLFAITAPLAERCRQLGGPTLRCVARIARIQRVLDNDAQYVEPQDMLADLRDDNHTLAAQLRQAHDLCREYGDIASASLLEGWMDQTEQRTRFLSEACRDANRSSHTRAAA